MGGARAGTRLCTGRRPQLCVAQGCGSGDGSRPSSGPLRCSLLTPVQHGCVGGAGAVQPCTGGERAGGLGGVGKPLGVTALCPQLLNSNVVNDLMLLESLLDNLASRQKDSCASVRRLALRGLANVASGSPSNVSRCQPHGGGGGGVRGEADGMGLCHWDTLWYWGPGEAAE